MMKKKKQKKEDINQISVLYLKSQYNSHFSKLNLNQDVN